MKKHTRRILSICLLAILLVTLAVPAAADALSYSLPVGEEQTLLFSEEPYISSNPSVVEVRAGNIEYEYVAVAKSVGTATLTGTWAGKEVTYDITVTEPVLSPEKAGSLFAGLAALGITGSFALFLVANLIPLLIFLLLTALTIGCCIFILIDAPKHGMTKAWALLPLLLNILALLIYLIVRSNQKNHPANPKHTVTCPTCNSVHPKGTEQCNVCGTELK